MPRVLVPLRISGMAPSPAERVHAFGGDTMGTTWQACVAGDADSPVSAWRQSIEQALDRVTNQMSTWLPCSDLSRFNTAPAGSWHELPAEFREVLACALEVAAASGGAFDPTAGKLVELWGFGPGPRYDAAGFHPPDDRAIDEAAGHCGWQRLRYDAGAGRLLQPGAARLDFSGIAKGYAVDLAMRALHDAGARNCMIEIGGELRGHGMKPDGQPWWVMLEPPAAGAAAAGLRPTRIALHDLGVATSGDYRRCFTSPAGERHAHTIDPRDGRPVRNALASVSVLHQECMRADAWATALMALGPDEGFTLACRRRLAALFVTRRPGGGFDERLTPALQDMML